MKLSEIREQQGPAQPREQGVTPLVRNVPLKLQACKMEYTVSKSKGNDQIVITWGLIGPANIVALDKAKGEKTTYSVQGQKVPMYLQWHDAQSSSLFEAFVNQMGLNLADIDLDPSNPESLDWIKDLAIEAKCSSEEGVKQVHNAETGETENQKDAEGNDMKSGARWRPVNVTDVLCRIERVSSFGS